MPASLDPSYIGIFVFGLVAGICPCNSVLCLGLIGYLTGSQNKLSFLDTLKLTVPFGAGTVIALLPLGILAALAGDYLQLINESIAWGFGGILLVLMGLQLLHVYKPPIRSVFNFLKGPRSMTAKGTFLLGISFGAITIGRAAPMLVVVLAYIGLYQGMLDGLITILLFALGLSLPLVIISSVGGTIGRKVKDMAKGSGEIFDIIIGIAVILIGLYFIYLALT